jgi:hypothetical protein
MKEHKDQAHTRAVLRQYVLASKEFIVHRWRDVNEMPAEPEVDVESAVQRKRTCS